MAQTDTLTRRAEDARRGSYLSRIGFETCDISGGRAYVRLAACPANANRAGRTHGGAIASLLGEAAALAAASARGTPGAEEVHVASTHVAFIEAADPRHVLDAEAEVVRIGRDVAHVRARAHAGNRTIASAQALCAFAAGAAAPTRGGPDDRFAGPPRGLAGSPYMQAAGARIDHTTRPPSVYLPAAPNSGGDGRIHEGALAGALDTAAALAIAAGAVGVRRGGTLTFSMVCARAVRSGFARATARVVGRVGTIFVCEGVITTASASAAPAVRAHIVYRVAPG